LYKDEEKVQKSVNDQEADVLSTAILTKEICPRTGVLHISQLSIEGSKESILRKEMISYEKNMDCFSNKQFGFISGRSTSPTVDKGTRQVDEIIDDSRAVDIWTAELSPRKNKYMRDRKNKSLATMDIICTPRSKKTTKNFRSSGCTYFKGSVLLWLGHLVENVQEGCQIASTDQGFILKERLRKLQLPTLAYRRSPWGPGVETYKIECSQMREADTTRGTQRRSLQNRQAKSPEDTRSRVGLSTTGMGYLSGY
ncbi:hypothetical protein Hamer_G025867, partial [Homarus americanus]